MLEFSVLRKSIREEALAVLWSCTRPSFTDADDLYEMSLYRNHIFFPEKLLIHIGHNFRIQEYLQFFHLVPAFRRDSMDASISNQPTCGTWINWTFISDQRAGGAIFQRGICVKMGDESYPYVRFGLRPPHPQGRDRELPQDEYEGGLCESLGTGEA
jgi:hypothetical protein